MILISATNVELMVQIKWLKTEDKLKGNIWVFQEAS